MLFKLIVLAGVLFAIYHFFFKNRKKSDALEEETLIECSGCNTYISKRDALISQRKYYCSEECIK